MERNEVTEFFGNIRKSVDKFHFSNHIDPWCVENMDPYKIPDLDNVNTVICEQLFKKVNSHTNCKSMNEARYFLFWLYNLDMHNLDRENLVSCTPDPRTEYRWENIEIKQVDMSDVKKMSMTESVDDVINSFNNISIKSVPNFQCDLCGAGYVSRGYLERHVLNKHEQEKNILF